MVNSLSNIYSDLKMKNRTKLIASAISSKGSTECLAIK